MINKALLDRLIAQLQELSAKADGIEALEARHAEHLKAKAEHETVVRELGQFRRELSDLQLQYQDQASTARSADGRHRSPRQRAA